MHKARFHITTIIGAVIVAYLAVLLIQTIRRNHDLNRQITTLEQQINRLTNEKEELQYKMQYYATDAFKEKEARANLGLQAPGEGVIILPKTPPPPPSATDAKKSTPKSNWQQWREFLFG